MLSVNYPSTTVIARKFDRSNFNRVGSLDASPLQRLVEIQDNVVGKKAVVSVQKLSDLLEL